MLLFDLIESISRKVNILQVEFAIYLLPKRSLSATLKLQFYSLSIRLLIDDFKKSILQRSTLKAQLSLFQYL